MRNFLMALVRDEQGADAVEYAGLVAVVAVLFAAVATAIQGHGGDISDALDNVVKTQILNFV